MEPDFLQGMSSIGVYKIKMYMAKKLHLMVHRRKSAKDALVKYQTTGF